MADEKHGIAPPDANDPPPDFAEVSVTPGTAFTPVDYDTTAAPVPLPPELEHPLTGQKGWVSLKNPRTIEIYIKTLAQTGRYVAAAAASGVSRGHASAFRDNHPEFKALCEEALERYKASLEAEAYRRAVHGVAEPVYHQGVMVGVTYKRSDKLLELFLKTKIPEFREGSGGGRTTVNVHASASASATAPGTPPTLDTARMSRAQREAYRAFLATMAPELAEGQPGEHAPPDPLPSARPMLDVTPGEPHEAAGASPRHESADRAREAPPAQAPPGEPTSDAGPDPVES
jgi:hypothetical protein